MEKSDFGLSYLCLTENVSSDVEHLALFSHDFACLQETILIWIPCGFLLCMLPFQIYQLISSNVKRIGWTTLNLLKTIVTSCLILLSVSNCVYRIHQWKYLGVEVSHAQYAAPFILTLTLCLALVFIELDRRKGIQSSAILFCFWLLLVVAGFLAYIANLIDLINHSYIKELFSFAFCMIYYPLVCGEFVLACYKDIPIWTVVSEDKNVCPDQQAGFLSVLLFWWFNKLIWKGYKNPIVKEDLWVLNNDNLTGTTSSVFEYHWKKKENLGKKRGLWHLIWTLTRGFGLSYLVTFFLRAGAETIPFIQPFILKLLIQYIENKGEEEWRGYAYTIVLFLLSLVNTLLLQQYYYKCLVTGMKIKSAVISAVFRKSLRLSNAAKKSSTTGEIVNLMSVDAQRFIDAMLYFNLVWTTPVQILITLYFLYTILGISVVAGIAVIGALLTCNGIIVSKWAFFENEEMNEKDKRMKVINEVLNGIKVLKLYAWEIPFEKVISDLREKELTFRKYLVYMLASATVSWMCTPFLVSLACYIMFIFYANGILSPQIAFVSLSFFNLLRFPLFMLPEVVSVMIQLRVSLKRLATFLSNDELDPDNVVNEFKKGVALEIENGSFSWDKEKNIILNDINLVVNEGQLVAIVGQVGSGKSSLISACLGEMEKVSGRVAVERKTAYVPQQAWIQNNTLRGNILFNKIYRENKYNTVIEACALTADLEVLPGGDKTEIGEKGINLSGGQKQRISLARAVYSNADVYFLDDPLSAVDAHVGKHIFDYVIGPSGLLKDKTRIFATNAVSYLPYVDLIVVIVKGTITEVGSYQELMKQNGAFSEFLQNYLISGNNSTSNEEVAEKNIDIIEDVMTSCEGLDRSPSMRILNRGISVVSVDKSQKDLDSPKNQSRLIEDEILETGDVKLRVYLLYLKYATYFLVSLVCIFTLVSSAFNIASTIWLKEWSADPTFNSSSFTEINIKTRDLRLIVYACLGIGQGIFTLLYYMMLGIAFISASRTLHKQLLKNILKSPMHFFDTTPLGRIVNRFGKDIDYVDHYITRNIDEILYFGVQVLSIIFVISYSTPIFMVVLVPLGIIYYFIQRFYIITSRQLKRLESISRSPIYSHFQESLAGVVTIRAYKQDERFITESESRVDANHSAFFTSIASNRWLSVRLEFVGNCVVFFAALFAVLSRDAIDPGVMGLSISYALMLTQGMSWMVIVACELETNIVAVERIQDYSEGITEADWVIENNRPSKQWPGNGRVYFENYQTRYRPGLDLVLKGINCNIIPGEKIGIAGRTGAGKSSLTLALFRIIEATSGSISIDDIDISKIGLHDLRSKLTIIPQDPVLFSGTLRMNLDPFNNNTDDELWTALEQSHLKNFVNSLTLGLQHEISEGGENLSVGQRQLVCLARALLRKTKVLILDEATAAIDLETDDLIQNTIRKEFKDCTILTIAHRLNTIMDSDRVMVLDQGVIKEFDTPSQLLLDTGSIFYMMSKDAGLLSENHKE